MFDTVRLVMWNSKREEDGDFPVNYKTERRIQRGTESITTGNQIQHTPVETLRARRCQPRGHGDDLLFDKGDGVDHPLDASFEVH